MLADFQVLVVPLVNQGFIFLKVKGWMVQELKRHIHIFAYTMHVCMSIHRVGLYTRKSETLYRSLLSLIGKWQNRCFLPFAPPNVKLKDDVLFIIGDVVCHVGT